MPSPSAFLVLLTGLLTGKVGNALAMVAAFGAGMALTLTGVGLIVLRGRDALLDRCLCLRPCLSRSSASMSFHRRPEALAGPADVRDGAGKRLVVRGGHARPRTVTTGAGAVEVSAPRRMAPGLGCPLVGGCDRRTGLLRGVEPVPAAHGELLCLLLRAAADVPVQERCVGHGLADRGALPHEHLENELDAAHHVRAQRRHSPTGGRHPISADADCPAAGSGEPAAGVSDQVSARSRQTVTSSASRAAVSSVVAEVFSRGAGSTAMITPEITMVAAHASP